jgi:hypothetical protein
LRTRTIMTFPKAPLPMTRSSTKLSTVMHSLRSSREDHESFRRSPPWMGATSSAVATVAEQASVCDVVVVVW